MMRAIIAMAALLLGFLPMASSWAQDGLLRMTSTQPPGTVLDRLEVLVRQRGLVVFARIDHGAGAAQAGLDLRPTQLLLFGHPKGGTPLMQCQQTAGIDLPLKALAWTDEHGSTQVAFNDPEYLARRHGMEDCPALTAMRRLASGLMADLAAQE